jgi:hypothetical protein
MEGSPFFFSLLEAEKWRYWVYSVFFEQKECILGRFWKWCPKKVWDGGRTMKENPPGKRLPKGRKGPRSIEEFTQNYLENVAIKG